MLRRPPLAAGCCSEQGWPKQTSLLVLVPGCPLPSFLIPPLPRNVLNFPAPLPLLLLRR